MHTATATPVSADRSAFESGAAARIHQNRNPLAAVRRPPDPFALGDVCTDAARPSEASYELARMLAVRVGEAELLDAHLYSLAVAPVQDLLCFKRAGGTIFFADTFLAGATSIEAGLQRGAPLDRAARTRYEDLDADPGHVFGVFDPMMHALIFTPQATPANHEQITLHELGHALTLPPMYRTAHLRGELLRGLPAEIDVMLRAYPQGNDRAAIRERVLEALAEAYVWTVVGRWQELPGALFGTLQGILTAGR